MHRVITAVVGVQQALIEVCQPDVNMSFADPDGNVVYLRSFPKP